MSLFNFNQEEMFSFFVVLVRFGVLCTVLPFIGDRFVPGPVKVLFALCVSFALFPALVSGRQIRPSDSHVWAASAGGIVGMIGVEAVFALILGYTARLVFDTVNLGSNLMGNFMGFAMASTYDPHQESQTEVVAEFQMAIAMLLFLAIDGHHLLLRASLDSYRIVGMGGLAAIGNGGFGPLFSEKIIELTGQVFRLGIQLAAPVAIALFAVNVAFGVFAKAMPQLNVFVLSFAVSAVVGLIVMFLCIPEFQSAVISIFEHTEEWMNVIMRSIAGSH
ncbi:MAG: flagellar biosynthetic protein FliR [Bdellovibrionota bacterium]